MDDQIRLIDLTTGYKDSHKSGRAKDSSHKDKICVTAAINATLHTGRLTCLLGPNGAGKSTLLKTLCAFIPPLSGRICIDGKDICDYSTRDLARTIGVVLTERPAAMNMTVAELVEIGRTPYTSFLGSLTQTDARIVNDAIHVVGIDALKTRAVHTLSDGERQKALVAKALAQQTRIILLDEPTAFLDYPSKVDLMKLLYRIAHQENKIIFMSTHDIELAMRLADELWLLDRDLGLTIGAPGHLASDGSIARYFERPGLHFEPHTLTFDIDR